MQRRTLVALATLAVTLSAPVFSQSGEICIAHVYSKTGPLEAYGKHYTIGFPHEEYQSGRPRIVSPLYQRLKSLNACFGSKLGWERPNWFAPKGMEPKDVYSMGRQNWFDAVGLEHKAVREAAGLFDQSSFAKYELRGRDAGAALDWICSNNVVRGSGRLTYTQMLNSRGGIECDLTIAQLTDDHFYIVTGTGFRTHDFAWIEDHIRPGLDAHLRDVTEEWGTLSLMGPQSRAILERVSGADVSNERRTDIAKRLPALPQDVGGVKRGDGVVGQGGAEVGRRDSRRV